ncbi:HD domain-containing protein [Anaerophilus nitritogenes]|uniref:HD domain-containing protein n=1 Tax=Anaerophilus nitritogenes TaxID=2498136 RepID=UPI00101C84D6|nr:HD domain-containing protein [Anaerophilus nitritogenes]
MIYRIRQFIQGLLAKITKEDIKFIEKYLNKEEIELFKKLRVSEQYHSLYVAYGCKSKFADDITLIRAALLHDIGKIESNLTLINKSIVVICIKLHFKKDILPKFIQKSLYYKNHHPQIGYNILFNMNIEDDVLYLVKNHHNEYCISSKALETLKYYDDMY